MAKEFHPNLILNLFIKKYIFASFLEFASISMIKILASKLNGSIVFFE